MANPTSNFNWQMPTASDLVTDLPADFEVFGQAVDTSLADLKGGTTDQVLAKNSNTDMDFKWVTSDDANAIQNSIVDAKGDLIAASANDTPARLAVGANGETLVADSSTSTGLKWGQPKGYGCSLYKSGSAQTINTTTLTTVTWQSELFDTTAFHDPTTNNSRITIPAGLGGLYQVNAFVQWTAAATNDRSIYLKVNNTSYYASMQVAASAVTTVTPLISTVLQLVAGDYLEIIAFQNSGTSQTIPIGDTTYGSNFSVAFIGA